MVGVYEAGSAPRTRLCSGCGVREWRWVSAPRRGNRDTTALGGRPFIRDEKRRDFGIFKIYSRDPFGAFDVT